MVLRNYNCPGNNLTSYCQEAIENDVKDIRLCITYCYVKPGANAVTLNSDQNDRCYCKTNACHNAKSTETSKNVISAYFDEF